MKVLFLGLLFAGAAQAQYHEYQAGDANHGAIKPNVQKILNENRGEIKGRLSSGNACSILVSADPRASFPNQFRFPAQITIASKESPLNQFKMFSVVRAAELSVFSDSALVGPATFPSTYEQVAPVVGRYKINLVAGRIVSAQLFTLEGNTVLQCSI